jgi:hypothetical protein
MNLKRLDARRVLRHAYSRLFGRYDYTSHVIALHEYRAIYMAVPKVANTSIKAAISPLIASGHASAEDAEEEVDRSLFRRRRNELFARKIRLLKHEVNEYQGYLVFAFVRNPWDRLVSCYKDKLATGSMLEGGRHKRPAQNTRGLGRRFSPGMSFEAFVQEVARTPDTSANRHFRSQHTFLTDRDHHLLPDFIGRYESLADDFATVMNRIGATDVTLPHIRRSATSTYREYYTPALADMVAERYRSDIELFGYSP